MSSAVLNSATSNVANNPQGLGEILVMCAVTRDWIRTKKDFRAKVAEVQTELRASFVKAWETLPDGDNSGDGTLSSDVQRHDLEKEETYLMLWTFDYDKNTKRDANLIAIDSDKHYYQIVKLFTEPARRGVYDVLKRQVIFYDELP